MTIEYALAIHGGAGAINKEIYSEKELNDYHLALKSTVKIGIDILQKGGTSMESVIACVVQMENNELFNAGRGAVFNEKGEIEHDACITDGITGKTGAISLAKKIKNPILAAHNVLTNCPHTILAGQAAEVFAQKNNLEIVDPKYFYTERRWKQLTEAQKKATQTLDHGSEGTGTVGAVALDQFGNLAAATSTGGMTNKYAGRISDSSINGAGNFALNNTCAVSGTGTGDKFIQNVLAYDLSALIEYKNYSLEKAAETVIAKLANVGGRGGLIAVNQKGEICLPYNTKGMFRAYSTSKENIKTAIFQDWRD